MFLRKYLILSCFCSGCVFPALPRNGYLRRVEYDITQEVEYKCERGTKLEGAPQVCGNHGKWIGVAPTCAGEFFDICNEKVFIGTLVPWQSYFIALAVSFLIYFHVYNLL